ncbi:MAG: hypothetical protein RL226_2360 [Bacteroidota bacterium]
MILYLRTMNVLRLLPNALTLANATLGGIAIWYLLWQQNPTAAAYCILGAAVADFLDGFAARALKVSGPLGKQLDSLADAVSFGVFPAFAGVYTMHALGVSDTWVLLSPLIILPASVYRLAKFNIDTRQEYGFIGVPTPANTLLWLGIMMSVVTLHPSAQALPLIIAGVAVLSAYLLNASFPLLSLKIANGKPSTPQLVLALASVVSYVVIYMILENAWAPVPIVLLLYPIISIITRNRHA